MPLTDPIGEPLIEERESLIPGLAPTKPALLPGIQTSKPFLYQTPGESENSEQLNLIETASQPKDEFSLTKSDALIINKASALKSIPSAQTSDPKTNSYSRDATTSEIDPLIGKLDSDLGDPLTNPNRIILPLVTASTTSEKAAPKTPLPASAETSSKPEDQKTLLPSGAILKSDSEPNKTAPATVSPTDKLEPNKTAPATVSPTDKLEPNKTAPVTVSPTDKLEPNKTVPITVSPTDKLEPNKTAPVTVSPTDKLEPNKTAPATVSTIIPDRSTNSSEKSDKNAVTNSTQTVAASPNIPSTDKTPTEKQSPVTTASDKIDSAKQSQNSTIVEKANSDEQSRTAEVSNKIDSDKKAPIAPTSETKNSDKQLPVAEATTKIDSDKKSPTVNAIATEKPTSNSQLPTTQPPTAPLILATSNPVKPDGNISAEVKSTDSKNPVQTPTQSLTDKPNDSQKVDPLKTEPAAIPKTAASENVAVTTAIAAVKTPESSPNNTDSVSEIKQPVKTESIVNQSVGAELIKKTDTTATTITAEINSGTVVLDIPVAEITGELETEQLPTKTESIIAVPEAADTVEHDITVAEITAQLETDNSIPALFPDYIAEFQPNSTQRTGDFQSHTNSPTNLSITAAANSPSGTFLVDDQGQVKFDYQFDGGYFTGEVGIFSLAGMEAFIPGTPEFIAEASRRVLSNSTDGHIVISDSTEGAKFTGAMPFDGDWGSGEYQGIKTFSMLPGDTFAVMLVPNATIQSSFQSSYSGNLFPENRPLFSIATANPNDTAHLLQIADITGSGNTFALEDMSPPNSDRDYNDLIFKISGATGNAPLLDTVINPDKEWRNTALGKQLLAEANPPNSDNNPPVVSPTSARTYTELETTISLDNLATDVEGDPLTISVLNPVNGTVIFNPLTNKASFKPATGFSGIASFDFLASDAFGSSTPARVTVNVSDVPLLNLDFVKRNPSLNAGENTELIVLGDFADQKGVVLPDSYLTYTSFNPEVAPIDPTGKVTGLTNGTSILSASRNNLQAVTPIRIGTMPAPTTDAQLHQILAEMYGLDPYPDAVSLTPGSTRKLSLGLNSNFTEANLTAASTGTRYFSNNSTILNVSPDGTITAVGLGDATVTAIHGTASATIPVRVEAPKIGTTALGTDGGIINSSDGTLAVMIPPGALKQNATVSIAPVNQQNLSLPLPPGFEFAGAFNLNFSDNSLNIPAQLAVPAPAGLAPGTVAYFLRKGAIPDSTGTWNPIWLQEESGIVGDDGNIRTQSPPYPGVVRPGEYAVVYASPTGSATLVKGQLTLNYNFPLAFFGIIDPLGNIGQLIDPDKFVTTPAFTVTRDISSVQVVAIPKVGLPVVTEVGVQRNDDGTATFKAALNMPAPTTSDPTTPPVLQKAELKFKDENNQQFENNEPLLFLTGGNILVNNASDSKGSRFEDLTVKFSFGNSMYEGTVVPTRSRSLGGNQYEVAVKVPDTVVLGASGVVLERKQNQTVEQKGVTPVYKEIQYHSNPIRLPEGAEYVFAALGGSDRVAVLNGKNPESVVDTTNSKDLLLAQIPVGTSGVTDWAESTAVTSDGNRVYATLRNSGQVALVDPMVLRQVDTVPNTSGVNPIVLPAGARPKSIVISPRDDYAYIGDLNQAKIYVLDINPNSATYHKVVETINVTSPLGLSQLAISSDGRRLFGTGSDNNEQVPNRRIYAINIDWKDRPKDEDSNPRKWHQQIGVIPTISETEGISATNEPTKMVFTNGLNLINTDQNDGPGLGVLEITSDDPLNFTTSVSYAPLSLGFATDYFDVNEGVSVTVTRDGRYGFVAGRNSGSLGPSADVRSGGNIGIIKDPLGPNPQLIGATRPIPEALTNDLVLSNDNKYLYGSYPSLTGSGSVYAFDVEEMIKTLDNPGQFKIDSLDRGVKSPFFNATTAKSVTAADFTRVPIDDINPAVSIAADYGILQENRPANQFTYGVLPGTTRAPVGTGGNLRDLSSAPTDWLNLKGPGATTNDLTPTFQWQFDPGWEDVKEVNLFVSTFEQGEGLLPEDRWEDLANIQNPNFNNLSPQQQQNLLAKWNSQFGTLDYNPNRILTATWKPGQGWVGLGGLPLDPSNTNTQFTLPDNRTLTAGQTYHWAVEALSKDGKRNLDVGQFKTSPPPALNGNSTFSSVTVLTHGFKPPVITAPGIPSEFYKMADSIATTGGEGLLMRYDSPTGNWVPVDKYGQVLGDFFSNLTYFPNGFDQAAPSYRTALSSYIAPYLQSNKPLVLLPDWSQNNESAIPDSGFTEGAADSFFASLVQLDQSLGGGANFDSQGNFVRSQGAIFNSPLHFVGFSRGAVVNSEIIQRVGTYFPLAGGKENSLFRDLQMTTLDPHDFDQPSFSVQLPFLGEAGFADFREPKVQVWKNVTFADNYYQTVPRLDQGIPQIPTLTPAGRDIPNLSGPDALRTEIRAGLKFPRNSAGELLGKPDETVFLGTRRNADGYENSLPGFTKDDLAGGPHGRVLTWYAGTADLGLTEYRQNSSSTQPVDPISRRRGDGHYEQLFDRDFSFSGSPQDPRVNPWYTPKYSGQPNFSLGAANAPNEGIGTGWFYSVLGGGLTKDPNTGAIANLRPTNNVERVPLSFDNTAERRMRGDFAIPTLFGGNFDAVFNPRSLFRNAISDAIPGWSFHGGTSNIASPTSRLVDWRDIPSLDNYRTLVGYDPAQPNYALRLTSGDSITHNRFVVPDWGALRFNLHVPELSGGQLKVSIQGDAPGYENYQPIGNIDLRVADGRVNPGNLAENAYPIGYADTDTNRIGYGNLGFETFHVDVPEVLRGKSAKLKFELEGNNTVYLDDVFFKSTHLMFGNPTLNGQVARPDAANNANNYLIEKPQYSLSYNESNKGSNWVSWQINKTWLGNLRPPEGGSAEPYDPFPWRSDSTLPSVLDTTEGWEYGGSRFDRGHLTAREQRNRTQKDQFATFLTTNLLPQEPDTNRLGAWRRLEDFSKSIVENRGWELYNIAGGYESYNDELPPDHPLNIENINVPELMWKVIVPLRPGQGIADVTANTPVIAVMLPNFATNPPGTMRTPWYDPTNITTIDRIEELTGIDLLSNLPDEIENILESRFYDGPVTVNDFPNVVT